MSNYKVLKLVIQTDNVVVIGNVWFSNAIWYAMNIFSGIIHKWISQHLTEHWWTLFQCCQATSHYQSQYGPRSMLSMVSLSPNDLNLPITQCIGFELAQGTQYLALMCNILIFFHGCCFENQTIVKRAWCNVIHTIWCFIGSCYHVTSLYPCGLWFIKTPLCCQGNIRTESHNECMCG